MSDDSITCLINLGEEAFGCNDDIETELKLAVFDFIKEAVERHDEYQPLLLAEIIQFVTTKVDFSDVDYLYGEIRACFAGALALFISALITVRRLLKTYLHLDRILPTNKQTVAFGYFGGPFVCNRTFNLRFEAYVRSIIIAKLPPNIAVAHLQDYGVDKTCTVLDGLVAMAIDEAKCTPRSSGMLFACDVPSSMQLHIHTSSIYGDPDPAQTDHHIRGSFFPCICDTPDLQSLPICRTIHIDNHHNDDLKYVELSFYWQSIDNQASEEYDGLTVRPEWSDQFGTIVWAYVRQEWWPGMICNPFISNFKYQRWGKQHLYKKHLVQFCGFNECNMVATNNIRPFTATCPETTARNYMEKTAWTRALQKATKQNDSIVEHQQQIDVRQYDDYFGTLVLRPKHILGSNKITIEVFPDRVIGRPTFTYVLLSKLENCIDIPS